MASLGKIVSCRLKKAAHASARGRIVLSDDKPLVAVREEFADGVLRGGQGVVRAPAALDLVRGGNFGCVEDIFEGCLQDGKEFFGFHAQEQRVEASLAAHGAEVDELGGVVTHKLCAQVFDGVNGRHLQVSLVRLREADIVLDEDVTTGESLAVGNANVGGKDTAVVEVKGFDIHAFSHDIKFIEIRPKCAGQSRMAQESFLPCTWCPSFPLHGAFSGTIEPMDLQPPIDVTTQDEYSADTPTPAAIVAGEVPASSAARPLSVFDMFSVGIGPSSSHTVGPMRAGLAFSTELCALPEYSRLSHVCVELFGSLGATGRGHNTDRAVLLGLAGYDPETVSIDTVESVIPSIASSGMLPFAGGRDIPFDIEADIRFLPRRVLPYHVNALTISAYGEASSTAGASRGQDSIARDDQACGKSSESVDYPGELLLQRTYYSVGGGFVMAQTNDDSEHPEIASLASAQETTGMCTPAPLPFSTGAELLEQCTRSGLSIAELVRANELSARPAAALTEYLDHIAHTMFGAIDAGIASTGILPGGLDVPRRANALAAQLRARAEKAFCLEKRHGWAGVMQDPLRAMDWVNLYALAVNEENAAGHRIVTAPTNGAAGVIPAVLGYLVSFCPEAGAEFPNCSPAQMARISELPLGGNSECARARQECIHEFLLAATAIGALIKTNASIAGAEVGCQGEVGSASAMAAAGLAQALGGTPEQVENAAEIAMEHSLGLTCDPVGGLVQIPCIERNAIAAVKAINAARMALWGDGRHTVSLDVAIETMRQTGNDMLSKYKETSAGGLAVNVVEC